MVQAVECLPSKNEALTSNLGTTKGKKKKSLKKAKVGMAMHICNPSTWDH
jgi:hypothetical protein